MIVISYLLRADLAHVTKPKHSIHLRFTQHSSTCASKTIVRSLQSTNNRPKLWTASVAADCLIAMRAVIILLAAVGLQAYLLPPDEYYTIDCKKVWPEERCFQSEETWASCRKSNSVVQWFPPRSNLGRQSRKDADAIVDSSPSLNATEGLVRVAIPRSSVSMPGTKENSHGGDGFGIDAERRQTYPKGHGLCCEMPDYCVTHFGWLNGGEADDAAECCYLIWSHLCTGYTIPRKFHPDGWNYSPKCSNPKPGFHE